MTFDATGLGLVEDAQQITAGIRDQSWVDVTLGTVGASLDTLSLAVDPLGTLGAWGVAWLLEHVRPLQEALDWLAGDSAAVAAQAAVWANVSAAVEETRRQYADRLTTDTADWHGASADAYRAHATENLSVLAGISVAAGGISSAVEGAGLIVGLVRGLVRDLIAQFIATLAIRLPQWAAVEGISLGTATPLIASQVATLVSTWAKKIQRHIRALLASLRNLTNKINGLEKILDLLHMRSGDMARRDPTRPPDDDGGSGPRRVDKDSAEVFVANIVSNPRSVVGRSAEEIADQFTAAGYTAFPERSLRKGTSGLAVQVRVEGHPVVTNIEVHPGGGRHSPAGSPYWKISTSTAGKIWVIDRHFRGAEGLRGQAVRYDE
ncbi:hypothetical protein [Actinoplanes rectilineatus]|uniref:hypothetical protein n=1 Tax=Actinoplanes rectilineatus TaxID=113571 RepID=UPI000698622E|nr:hypothetical protein [Actinoplanes rectilineatus]